MKTEEFESFNQQLSSDSFWLKLGDQLLIWLPSFFTVFLNKQQKRRREALLTLRKWKKSSFVSVDQLV